MPTWENIVFDGLSPHPLESDMLEIMQSTYRSAGLSPPDTIDHWWHSPSIGYQLNADGSAPTIVIINVREGEPDQPKMNTHFTINLDRLSVKDRKSNRYIEIPGEIAPRLNKVRQWVCDDIANKKRPREIASSVTVALPSGQRLSGQMLKALEDRLRRMQEFNHRLFTHSLLEDDTLRDVVQCPLCSSAIVQCEDCKAISCCSPSCQARRIFAIETHPTRSTSLCHPCLETSSNLTTCPECKQWFRAPIGFRWCLGKPLGKRSGRSSSQITRQHPPKVIGCDACIREGQELLTPCSSETCWSRTAPPNISLAQANAKVIICDDCSPDGGETCECGRIWVCDTCFPKHSKHSSVCPRCKKCSCGQSATCKKVRVQSCRNCGNTPPCDDCITEAEKMTHPDALTRTCEDCEARFCESCWKEVGVECAGCEATKVCPDCAKQCQNDECDGESYCPNCAPDYCLSCDFSMDWESTQHEQRRWEIANQGFSFMMPFS
ncbi:hypothetical protein CONPUDRAFT_69802 [Coniophora puteana RWD-64-598 SS2]|uniref:Uncharacterized protein n=1 Tax=Coniophora puteana (strain RWD-64-598) TaxID=741705 RepID=A0A5M3N060_CONPW|nr:uncharacterized protein CONPUDRAFT_69802 [Coniophora puteana RWD-64-598 SS2]EIW84803.1 hypothetical protein CONPUDRAFT_69802 [Coniophora puteana RWD-64-598 SS2]